MKVLAVLALAVMTSILCPSASHPSALGHYAGRLPAGHDVTFYLHICFVCGEFYGGEVERSCIFDKTFATFYNCVAAILH